MRIFKKAKKRELEVQIICEPAEPKITATEPRSFKLEDFETWMDNIHSSYKMSPEMRLKIAKTK